MKTSELEKPILEKIEDNTFNEDDFEQLPPNDIVAYNESRSGSEILRLHSNKDLDIQPEFQRDFIWDLSDQTRFIDSLIKQLPIPSLCFSYDYITEKWQVIDGLQRISTIIKFLTDDEWKLSNLKDINKDLSGHYVKDIKTSSDLIKYYKRVENTTLPITVLRCDYSKPSHQKYLFKIFHRLNTGGKKLNNQEIRNCIYSGKLNNLLRELDKNNNWMELNEIKQDKTNRFITQEMILRFFVFYDNLDNYNGRLTNFLNTYMGEHKNPDDNFLEQKKILFTNTIDIVYKKIFKDKSEKKLSKTLLEALLHGVVKNIDFLEKMTPDDLYKKYLLFREHEVFSLENLSSWITDKDKVQERLKAAEKIFSDEI